MLTPERLFLVRQPVDMRGGVDVLTQYVRTSLSTPWHDGAAFLFTNKTRTRIKLLRWDKHGVWLCARRLHRGALPGRATATAHGRSRRSSSTGLSPASTGRKCPAMT